jgi:hypothetical protein
MNRRALPEHAPETKRIQAAIGDLLAMISPLPLTTILGR